MTENPVKALQVTVQALRQDLAQSRVRAAEFSGRISELEQQINALKASVAWRTLKPALRAWMSPSSIGLGNTILDDIDRLLNDLRLASESFENELRDPLLAREFSDDFMDRGYDVSVLVLNRDGKEHLERFFTSFAAHHDRDLAEFVIVDHCSKDGSLELIRQWMSRLPIKLLRCGRNQRYSVANNLARRFAGGSTLVFANNDIVFDQPVLPTMLDALDSDLAGLVGLPLYYTDERGGRSERLQHAGIRFLFDWEFGFMRPHNHQSFSIDEKLQEVPAVTTALAACKADVFDEAGGFDERYDYGFEDVHLCLQTGMDLGYQTLLCTSVSALHCEFGTQARDQEEIVIERRENNALQLKESFGQKLIRQVTHSQLANQQWHHSPFALAVAGEPDSLSDLMTQATGGIYVYPLPAKETESETRHPDAILVQEPEILKDLGQLQSGVLIGKVSPGGAKAWLVSREARHVDFFWCSNEQDASLLLNEFLAAVAVFVPDEQEAGSSALEFLTGELLGLFNRTGVALKIATPAEDVIDEWGDYHFAGSLGRSMRKLGYRVRTDIHPDWHGSRLLPDDTSVALRGLAPCEPIRGQCNLLWLISHPLDAGDHELEKFDHVFVASESYSRLLSERLRTTVSTLLQCTDTSRFQYQEHAAHPRRVLFVGNSRGVYRPVLKAAMDQQIPVSVFGTHWDEFLEAKDISGHYVPNAELGALYGDSGAVLNDHWDDMKQLGFISNRVFDVLATGTRLVTDRVKGLDALLGGAQPLLTPDFGNLPELLQGALEDSDQRRALAEQVASAHSFDARSAQLAGYIKRI